MKQPNIVWITLDSVRSDHTTVDGYKRDTTPNMYEIGVEGYNFSHCIAHSKSTLPSSAAILTCTAPSHNTVGMSGKMLPSTIPTVATRFSQAGYQTACLSRNSYVSSATGLDRGFDRFQWIASETLSELSYVTLIKYLVNIQSHSAGITRDTAKHSSAYLMNETAKRWVKKFDRDQPFFFYLHYNEPHRPYYPPLSYLDHYTENINMAPREAAEFALDVHYSNEKIIAEGCNLSAEEWEALHAMYDAEIAYTDMMVGQLVEYIRSASSGNTVFVITADHGELFGEHGLLSHRYVLSDAVTRVPLVCEGIEHSLAVSNDEILQHTDMMRTLLSLAGADTTDTLGSDLRYTSPTFAISQRGRVDFSELYAHNQDFDASSFHKSVLNSLRTVSHRYQESETGRELFALPDERTDVSEEYPEITDNLEEQLHAWLDHHADPVKKDRRSQFTEAVRRQLQELGYTQ